MALDGAPAPSKDAAAALIAPAPDDFLEFCEVWTAVNGAANDYAALIEPLAGVNGQNRVARAKPTKDKHLCSKCFTPTFANGPPNKPRQ